VPRPAATTFEDLIVWQKAHQLVLNVYQLTRSLPKEELFGLVSQMRRSAVSIPANIAEGFKRRGRADKARHMNIAQGSLEELRYHFLLCGDLDYLKKGTAAEQIAEVGRLLNAYTQSLQASTS
jgi:four helix bundle protein